MEGILQSDKGMKALALASEGDMIPPQTPVILWGGWGGIRTGYQAKATT